MTKLWAEFHSFVAPEVSGCPIPVIDHHLMLAAREFCQRTGAWREWVDEFTADGTTNRFDYDLGVQQELVKVAQALRNGTELGVRAGGSALPPDWDDGDSTKSYAQDTLVHFDSAEFVVFPQPTAGDVFRLEIVFKPTLGSTGVGDLVFDSYCNEIATGAKARILKMPRRDWTDFALSAHHSTQFELAIARAANKSTARTETGRPRRQRVGIR